MEADSTHSIIECAQRNISIYSVFQWLTVSVITRSKWNQSKEKEKKLFKEGYNVKELKCENLSANIIENRNKDFKDNTVQ